MLHLNCIQQFTESSWMSRSSDVVRLVWKIWLITFKFDAGGEAVNTFNIWVKSFDKSSATSWKWTARWRIVWEEQSSHQKQQKKSSLLFSTHTSCVCAHSNGNYKSYVRALLSIKVEIFHRTLNCETSQWNVCCCSSSLRNPRSRWYTAQSGNSREISLGLDCGILWNFMRTPSNLRRNFTGKKAAERNNAPRARSVGGWKSATKNLESHHVHIESTWFAICCSYLRACCCGALQSHFRCEWVRERDRFSHILCCLQLTKTQH